MANSRLFTVDPADPIVQTYFDAGGVAQFDVEEAHAGGLFLGGSTQPVKINGIAGTSQTVSTGLGMLSALCWTANGHSVLLESDSPNVTVADLMTIAQSMS